MPKRVNGLAATTDPTRVETGSIEEKPARWSTRIEWFDSLVVVATLVLGAASVWVGSAIVGDGFEYLQVSLGWGLVGAAWAATVLVRTTDRVARFAVAGVVLASVLTVSVFGPIVFLLFSTPSDWVPVGLIVVAAVIVFLVRQRPIRLVWFVAPALVVASAAIVLSGVARSARFAAAEPQLTAYVIGLDQGAALPDYDQPTIVGSVPVYEVIREDGQTLLVTGFIGILGDDPAGLAYVPEGTPVGVGWEHITGPWFKWIPLGYVSD
jgi:hypothetical protein